MKSKKIFSIVLAILMVSSLTAVASATNQTGGTQGQVLISTKQEMIAGISTTVNQYNNNGVIVETFSINDPNVSDAAMEAFTEALNNRPAPQSVYASSASTRAAPDVGNYASRSFTSRDYTQNGKGTIVQNGKFCRGSDNHVLAWYLWVENGRSISTYAEPNNVPKKISMELEYQTSGASLSVGIPPSISGSVGHSVYTMDLGEFSGTTAATAYWPNYGGYQEGNSSFGLTVKSKTVFSFSSTSYSAATVDTQNYVTGW